MAAGAAPDRPAGGYGASYAIYGDVDVDALLAIARPWAPFRAWRKGDDAGGGRFATTAGVTIDICDDRGDLEPALLRFLMEERAFLSAAARLVSPAVASVLTCRMQIGAGRPGQVLLASTTVAQVAAARVDLQVVGYPGAEHERP